MLPTHFAQGQQLAGDSSSASAGLSSSDAMNGTFYPPTSAISTTATSTTSIAYKNDASSMQNRLFGSRGITACTVQAQPPYDREDMRTASSTADERRGRTNSLSTKQSHHVQVQAPRWNTWEFRLYAIVFITIVPVMCWIPIRLSLSTAQNYPLYSSHLVKGWMFGRLRDDSDFQYKSFRDYVPVLCIVMMAFLALSHLTERLKSSSSAAYQAISPDGKAFGRPNRVAFLTFFTAAFVLTLHGANTIKLLTVCLINFTFAKLLAGTPFAIPVAWAFNVATLFAVHYYEGFQWESISQSLAWVDSYNGLLPRWQINFNITMLRLVAFALDSHWAKKASLSAKEDQPQSQLSTSPEAQGPELDARKRSEIPLELRYYSLHTYLLYTLYPPLFIAGPIMTFNDFCKQLYAPLGVSRRYTLLYAIRWIFSLLSMEFMLHFLYVNAIKDAKAWHGATSLELSMIGFWNLIVVWLKLLLPWRFFRLWALADGVDAPENMIRCMANNYSTLGFWRSWHRSYNLWIVRYIYVPVGGAKNAIPATLLVFTFVALWHDLSLKLLTWGWLVTLFILPEVAARRFVSQKEYGHHWWFRHLAAAGGVVNVLMMMTANLVGFAIGTDGMAYMWEQLLSSWDGLFFMLSACATLFVGVQVMFEYREEELRRGIDRKC